MTDLLLSSVQSAWVTLGISQLILTALWALPSAYRTRASIPANAIIAGGSLLLCFLSYAEHTRSIRPSFLLNIYLFPALLFDIARVRTLWLRWDSWEGRTIAIIASVAVSLRFSLLLLETTEKRSILRDEYKSSPPEATSGVFSRYFFLWLNPLFKKGFSSLMGVDDLFALDKQLHSERLQNHLESKWDQSKLSMPGDVSLIWVY